MKRADWLALAERAEKATGADQELDLAIALARGWERKWEGCVASGHLGWWLRQPGGSWTWASDADLPAFTASLDAALLLKDPEWAIELMHEPGEKAIAHTWPRARRHRSVTCTGYAADLPRAAVAAMLRAAACRARAQEVGDE